jgi:hypothetical protein
LGATISPDTASGFNPTVNVARSNGSSVFAGLAANTGDQLAQVSTQPGQTSLTNDQVGNINDLFNPQQVIDEQGNIVN